MIYTMQQISEFGNFDLKVDNLVLKITDAIRSHCSNYQFCEQCESINFTYRITDEMTYGFIEFTKISHSTYDNNDNRILVFNQYHVNFTIDERMSDEYGDEFAYTLPCIVSHNSVYGDGGYYIGSLTTKFRLTDTDEQFDEKINNIIKCIFNECDISDYSKHFKNDDDENDE